MLSRIIKRTSEIASYFGFIGITIMIGLTTLDVALRYLFSSPLLGSMELTELLMVTVAGLTIGWCTLNAGHVRVDILINMFSQKTRKKIDILNLFLTLGICSLIPPALLRKYFEATFMDLRTYVLRIPEGPFMLIMAFGYFLMLLVVIIKIIEGIKGER